MPNSPASGTLDAAAAAYDAAIAWLEPQTEGVQRAALVYATALKADIFLQQEQYDDGLSLLNDVLRRFDDDDDIRVQVQIASAMIDKAVALGNSERHSEEQSTYDEITARFGSIDNNAMRERVTRAMAFKGAMLASREQVAAATEAFEKALALGGSLQIEGMRSTVDQTRFWFGNLLANRTDDLARAEALFAAISTGPLHEARYHRAWIALLDERPSDATALREGLEGMGSARMSLLDAALELVGANFGRATQLLMPHVEGHLEENEAQFNGDFERLLRVAVATGHGEALLQWFNDIGYTDRAAPLVSAFAAYLRGAEVLFDVNPEVRTAASVIYQQLSFHRSSGKEKPNTSARPERRTRRGKSSVP